MLGLPHAGGGIPSCTRGRGCLRVQCVHGLSRVVARKTIVPCSGDIMRAYTQGKSHARPSALAASKVKEREFLRPASSFFSGRAPPSLRRSSFSALPVLSSVSTQGHTTLSTVVALRTLIGACNCAGAFRHRPAPLPGGHTHNAGLVMLETATGRAREQLHQATFQYRAANARPFFAAALHPRLLWPQGAPAPPQATPFRATGPCPAWR